MRVWISAAAELVLLQLLADAGDHGRTGDEHLRRILDDHRVVAGHDARRAEARGRAERQRDAGHRRQVLQHVDPFPPVIAGQQRMALGLDVFHRAAAAGAVDQAHDRQPQVARHALGGQRLLEDAGVVGAAAHGEIVARDHHPPPVDQRATEHEIRRGEVLQLAGLVIDADAGRGADLAEGVGIDQGASMRSRTVSLPWL